MKLYFSPLACSLATRIVLYEVGAEAEFVEVDSKTKKMPDGADFRAIHPLGLVPALDIGAPRLLTENAAVLQYVADAFPESDLAPRDAIERARLQEWLGFIATELHKALFVPLLDPNAPEGARAFALAKADSRLAWIAARLDAAEFLLERFSVADAYLFTVLNWSIVTPVSLARWPSIKAYSGRLRRRPSVAKAYGEERTLYARELARHTVSGAWNGLKKLVGGDDTVAD